VILVPPAAQHVGLALHELSANAVQYGSLSVSTGKVAFRWQIDNPDKLLQLTWLERGGPPARVPTQKKFGCLVLERLVPEGLGGWAALSFDARVWSGPARCPSSGSLPHDIQRLTQC
jgi:two-component sensor histidine kinase